VLQLVFKERESAVDRDIYICMLESNMPLFFFLLEKTDARHDT
jgi:hypothetical protein